MKQRATEDVSENGGIHGPAQTVSVAISVLTLTFISVDRWYAICFPLKFKSTTGRAKTAIIIIWLLALAVDIPELMVLQTQRRKDLRIDTHFFTQCGSSWSERSELTFHVLKAVLLYTVPLVFMSVAYCQIVRVLWRSDNIPGHTETMNYYGTATCNNAVSANRRNTLNTNANVTTEGQLRSRRKAAKMLVAVVIMFAVCYFPVHVLSILRYTMGIPTSDVTVAISLLAHWLCYFNSAVNPVIYNFMSGKFRKEFRRTFGIWCCDERRFSRRRRCMSTIHAGSSTYVCRYTTGGSTSYTARTEIVPLSGISSNVTIADAD